MEKIVYLSKEDPPGVIQSSRLHLAGRRRGYCLPLIGTRRASWPLMQVLSILSLALMLLAGNPAAGARAAVTGCLNGQIVGVASTTDGAGYWLAGSDGGVFSFGSAPFYGSAGNLHLNKPIVAIVATATAQGYWLVAADGGVFAYGDATPVANNPLPTMHLNQPIVGAARAGNAAGLWLTAADGGVFALNGAPFYGSASNLRLNKPIVAIVATATAQGYWLVAADGGVFAYGDATPVADNPLPAMHLNQPIVGAARAGNTAGLWLTAGDGGVFALSGAPFYGSAGNLRLNYPVTGIASVPSGTGYWLGAADGGLFSYHAGFFGSAVSSTCAAPAPSNGNLAQVVRIAQAIKNGQSEPGWDGGYVPYSWGGGHQNRPGPTTGTCAGYTGAIHPCPASTTRGVDCSGFTRWVYALAFGADVLGAGNTNDQIRRLHKVSTPQPGDLVYYGRSTGSTHHVGIYIGNGKMINARKTGTNVEIDSISVMPDFIGYFHYER